MTFISGPKKWSFTRREVQAGWASIESSLSRHVDFRRLCWRVLLKVSVEACLSIFERALDFARDFWQPEAADYLTIFPDKQLAQKETCRSDQSAVSERLTSCLARAKVAAKKAELQSLLCES